MRILRKKELAEKAFCLKGHVEVDNRRNEKWDKNRGSVLKDDPVSIKYSSNIFKLLLNFITN